MAGIASDKRELFISRAGENSKTAVAIDAILCKAGHKTFIQDRDFGHTSFVDRMAEGFGKVDQGGAVIALLSPAYLESDHCLKEARYPLIDDPSNRKQRLIVLRIAECKPTDFLKDIPYVDLVPLLLDVEGFERAVLSAVTPRPEREAVIEAKGQVLHPEIRAVPGFTGREAELESIETALWERGGKAALTDTKAHSDGATTAAVKGMGGVGKSVLAQEYAWRNRDRYQGVWWVRAETSETLLDDLIELGARFIPGIREVPDRTKAAQAALAHIAQTEWEKPWLLVYDNVESPAAIDNLTPASGAHVLVTTRWQDWYGHAEDVAVDVFDRDAAIQFLLDATKRTDREGAGQLADALGRLPLALDHAAAYMRRTGDDFGTYVRLAADLLHKAPKGVGYARPVFATLELAIAKAVEACPEAEKLIGICAFLAPDRIPLDLFPADVLTEIERGEAVAALAEVSLVTRETLDDGSPGIGVHRLVQQAVRRRSEAKKSAPTLRILVDAFPQPESPNDVTVWPQCAKLLPHVLAALEHARDVRGDADRTVALLQRSAIYLYGRADYEGAERHIRRALAIDEAGFGPDHAAVANHLNNLAQLLQATNRLGEAEPLMRRALAIGEKTFGPDHPTVAIRLNNLAVLREEGFGDFIESEGLKRRALTILERNLGPEDPLVAIAVSNLAQLLKATNRVGEAESLMRRTLTIGEKNFGPNHPSVATHLNNLGALLKDTDRLAEAEPLMRRALEIDEKSFGPNHPDVARDLNNLAQLFKATDRLGEAEPLMRRALAIDEKGFGPDHPDVARDLNNLGALLQATNRLGEAETLMHRALEIDEKSFGPDHPDVATDLNNLALLLQATNRLAEAEPLMRRALAIDEASFGPDHPEVATDLNNLALLLQATNRLAEAEPLMRRALAIDEASFGPDHPEVATDLNNLAQLLKATNRLAEAEPLLRRALAIFEASLGPDHPSTRTARNNLAGLEGEMREHAAGPAPTPAAAPAPPPRPASPGLLRHLLGRA